mmetsp:Transcript_55828/g.181266  ORF Transcript_55828/g.181266 Transcript_55828/m.181266 type:complete len:868 (+) Transcript_55828:141-2744(+)
MRRPLSQPSMEVSFMEPLLSSGSSQPPLPAKTASEAQLRPGPLEDVEASDPEFQLKRARSASPFSRRGGPLSRRSASKNQNWARYNVGSGAISEWLQYTSKPYCVGGHCGKELGPLEIQHGTGLCNKCYDGCEKDCMICQNKIMVVQLGFQSGLCNKCYDRCQKTCKVCTASLAKEQLRWDTGLCDHCYNENKHKSCEMCQNPLQKQEFKWGTGLCDECYNDVLKFCRICHEKISDKELRWSSGMCNTCYDKSGKECRKCASSIRLGSAHWRSRMCETCFATTPKNCNKCGIFVDNTQTQWQTTHLCVNCFGKMKENNCEMCRKYVSSTERSWGTGLCNECYDKQLKECHKCKTALSFCDMRWGSGLCNRCFDSCEKECKGTCCGKRIPLPELHWNTMLCNECYRSCDRTCRGCRNQIHLGSLHYGTGLCDTCWDRQKQNRDENPGLSRGVWAVIVAQCVFYVAPGMLQPSLYLQIQTADYPPSPATAYAAVLMTASFAAMLAPVPLGFWADRKGEREVYCGMAMVGVLSSFVFLLKIPVPIFALAWAAMNLPPAIRGVRAVYFAKNVEPDDLSRAGNLASSFGLFGGFSGPLISIAAHRAFRSEAPDAWLNSFTAGAAISALAFALCFLGLAFFLVAPKRKKLALAGPSAGGQKVQVKNRICERCDKELSAEEQNFCQALCDKCFRRRCERCNALFDQEQLSKQLEYTTALCDPCWDNYGGSNKSWKQFRMEVLICFCVLSVLLELGMNAAVIATFQPLAVGHFGWGNDAIAAVNFAGAGLSVLISLTMAYLRLPERVQMGLAASLYFLSVLLYSFPPLSEWRLVVGLMLGIKAQILFMAPFTAIFSRLIGGILQNVYNSCGARHL